MTGAMGIRVAVMLALLTAIAVYARTDSTLISNVCYLGVLVAAGVGACIGARRAAPGQRLVPWLIAAGVVLTALGDVLWGALDLMGAGTDVSIADLPWFASYATLCAAVWIVLRRSRHGGRVDTDFLIDLVTIVVVSVLVFWSVSVDTIVADQSVTPFARVVLSAYPVADAILLALVFRALISRSARTVVDATFAVGVLLWLAADLIYLHAPAESPAMLMADAAWMVAPVLVARTAWRAGTDHTQVPGPSASGSSMPQLLIAVAPLLVPPALELAADLRGEPDQPLQLFVGTALLTALAFARTARLIRSAERARRDLEVARDAALAASKAKSMFLTNMSHEIRTPLTTVLATAEILEDTPLDAVQSEMLAKMNRSGELLRRLVEGILDFSRIEAGRLELVSTPFDLHAMVADAADLYVRRAKQEGIRFGWQLDPGVPRGVVGDCGRLIQVLTNLLDNALKFTDEGEVTLTVRSCRGGDADGVSVVEFTVVDTGIGIREEDLASVFESFSQVDGSITRRHGGCGLGLAICKELTELMGGSIALHSQFGAGTTFVVRVPLIEAAADLSPGSPRGARPLRRSLAPAQPSLRRPDAPRSSDRRSAPPASR